MAKVTISDEFSFKMPTAISGIATAMFNNSVSISYAGYDFSLSGDFVFDLQSFEPSGNVYSIHITSPGGYASIANVSMRLSDVKSHIEQRALVPLLEKALAGNDTVSGASAVSFGGAGDDTMEWKASGTVFGGSGVDTYKALFNLESYSIRSTEMGTILKANFNGEEVALIGVEKIKFTDQTFDISSASPFYDFAAAARTAIVREGSNDFLAYQDGKAGSKAAIVAALIKEAGDSTLPAAVVYGEIMGKTPGSAHLDGLAAFVDMQIHSAGYQSTANPRLGGYEAMGLGLSGTAEFAARFGGGTDADMVRVEYQHLFGRAASAAQINHFVAQIDYFEELYLGAGVEGAAIKARGAAVGQMIGYAAQEGAPIHAAAVAWLTDLANGKAGYGAALEMI